jgi:hypothetical protein
MTLLHSGLAQRGNSGGGKVRIRGGGCGEKTTVITDDRKRSGGGGAVPPRPWVGLEGTSNTRGGGDGAAMDHNRTYGGGTRSLQIVPAS